MVQRYLAGTGSALTATALPAMLPAPDTFAREARDVASWVARDPLSDGSATRRAALPDPKVYVVEDDPGMCDCLHDLLASVAIPAETYANAEEFLESENGSRAGCLVTDVCLPGMSGFDLQRALARRSIRLPIIMITGYGDVRTAVRAMKAGAVDFIEKPFSGQLLLDSIGYALKLSGQVNSAEAQRDELRQRFALLTPREREVMGLVVTGRTNKWIAREFGISVKTIEIHRGQVMAKLKAGSVAELVRFAAILERPG
jgi:FixJ family two-component response regulator